MSHFEWFNVWLNHHEYDQEEVIGMPCGSSWWLFYKNKEKRFICTEGHFNIFIGRKIIMKVLIFKVQSSM